jgi:amidohydrolase
MSLEGTTCACSAGVLQAGTAANVIPSHAVLKGTLRTFTPEQTAGALANMDHLLAELTAETGCTFSLRLNDHAPAVTNDPAMTDLVRGIATGVVGEHSVLHMPPVSPSDDVSFFLDRIPGCYFFVGAGLADGSSGMHHNPGFAIDEACMPIGASVLAAAAVAAADR